MNVIFKRAETKKQRNKGSKIVGKLFEVHLNISDHFRRFPVRNPKIFRLHTKDKQFIHHFNKAKRFKRVSYLLQCKRKGTSLA